MYSLTFKDLRTSSSRSVGGYLRFDAGILAAYLHCRDVPGVCDASSGSKMGEQPGGSDSQALAQDAEVEEELV